jgi:hypothetical protein
LAIKKKILQISTDLKVVRELSILEDQFHTTSPTHERRHIQKPQQQLITSLPPPLLTSKHQTPSAITSLPNNKLITRRHITTSVSSNQ